MWKTFGSVALALTLTLSTAWSQGTPPDPKAAMTRALIAKQSSEARTLGYRACSSVTRVVGLGHISPAPSIPLHRIKQLSADPLAPAP